MGEAPLELVGECRVSLGLWFRPGAILGCDLPLAPSTTGRVGHEMSEQLRATLKDLRERVDRIGVRL